MLVTFRREIKNFQSFQLEIFAKFEFLLDLLSDFCKACRARAIEGFLALYDEKLVGNENKIIFFSYRCGQYRDSKHWNFGLFNSLI